MSEQFEKGAKEYRKGMHAAKMDCEKCGEDYARNEYRYGLKGCSDTFCKGYQDYLSRYAR